jgi:hypothetical protein
MDVQMPIPRKRWNIKAPVYRLNPIWTNKAPRIAMKAKTVLDRA